MTISAFVLLFALLSTALAGAVLYVYRLRARLDEMHGMMAGMGFGMMAGLVTATLWTAPSGDFLWGVILGSVAGLLIGVPVGKLGGHLGILEGIMAGPMGGMMGAMLGQMIRPYDLEVFMPFFAFLVLLTLAGITYAARCGARGRDRPDKQPEPLSAVFVGGWTSAVFIVVFMSVLLPFPLDGASAAALRGLTAEPLAVSPQGFRSFTQEITSTARQENGVQTASIAVSQSRYTPNVTTVKKGVPLRLTFTADESAGCAREVVFPTLNISRILPVGQTVTLDILPEQAGDLPFQCSIDMSRGKLVVTE